MVYAAAPAGDSGVAPTAAGTAGMSERDTGKGTVSEALKIA
jgi:hypothetical protein